MKLRLRGVYHRASRQIIAAGVYTPAATALPVEQGQFC